MRLCEDLKGQERLDTFLQHENISDYELRVNHLRIEITGHGVQIEELKQKLLAIDTVYKQQVIITNNS